MKSFSTLLWLILRRRQWQPTPVLLPGKSHGRRSLVGCSPWGRKGQTRLSDFTFTFNFHALEKEMATHSSVLAWRIPGTGESGGLSSMGLPRVGHDWSDLAAAAAGISSIWDLYLNRKHQNDGRIYPIQKENKKKSHCYLAISHMKKLETFSLI